VPIFAGYTTTRKIYESSDTVVFRACHPKSEKTFILKVLKGDHPEVEKLDRLRQEYSLLSILDSPYIIKTYGLENYHNSLVLVLEDCDEDYGLLSEIITPDHSDQSGFLVIAIEITKALEVVHNNGIIYRDLKPDNILVHKKRTHVKLFDFNLSTGPHDNLKATCTAAMLEGSLPYISPEQTGRLSMVVDYRTDFYSLGVTLYQLATGILPFTANDPGELIHAHVAQLPVSPSNVNTDCIPELSAIILKLLEKSPENRYQHCYEILSDLNRCRADLNRFGVISNFSPGQNNPAQQLKLPALFHCRKAEMDILSTQLKNTAADNAVFILLTGKSGVGKSSLVQEFKNSHFQEKAYFIQGSFGTESNEIPYEAISLSLRHLIHQILAENSETIQVWRKKLLQVLNGDGRVLTDILPELEYIIGPQPPTAKISPPEAEQRLVTTLRKFIQTCCHIGPPIILFLDDLQNADAASIKIVEQILLSPDLLRILFIGAFRTDDVSLPPFLETFQSALSTRNVTHIHLDNLEQDIVCSLLRFNIGTTSQDITGLAEICYQKTGGNPFYLKQFLQSLTREELIWYSQTAERWEWDETSIRNKTLTDNIADILVQNIENLPPQSKDVLQTASCLGVIFESEHLAIVLREPVPLIEKHLESAIQAGFILQVDSCSPVYPDIRYQFSHEQIRQTIHSQLSESEKQKIHFTLGNHLSDLTDESNYQHILFQIAGHLNRGAGLASSREEKLRIARVNCDAGEKATLATAYPAAHLYFQAGLDILPVDSWQKEYDLSLKIHEKTCETAYMCKSYDTLDALFTQVCFHARDIFDTCKVYSIRIQSLKAQNRSSDAISAGLKILALLGINLPESPSRYHVLKAFTLTRLRLTAYSHERLLHLPEMTDRKTRIIMSFLQNIGSAAYTTVPKLLPLISAHAIRLSLKYGYSPESARMGYIVHGFLLCSRSGHAINTGYAFGRLAVELQKRISPKEKYCLPLAVHSSFIRHWKEHIRDTLPELRNGIKDCKNSNDIHLSAHMACACSFRLYLLGTNLNRARNEIEDHCKHIIQLGQESPLNRLNICRQAISNLLHESDDPILLQGIYYDEDSMKTVLQTSGDYTALGQLYIIKLIHAVIFNRYTEALEISEEAEKFLIYIPASVFIPVYYFYDSLTRLSIYHTQSPLQKLKSALKVRRNQRKMRIWAYHAPQNYSHKYSLVEAERERVRGNSERAMEWYDKAIHLARKHDYLHEEAISYECAARFYYSHSKSHIARPYMREARYCYYRWGATAKIHQLDSKEWIVNASGERNEPVHSESIPVSNTLIPGVGGSRLDMMTVIKASRVLNSEMVLDELLKKMMRIMLESAGAQRGFLIFKEEDEWSIRVRGSIYRNSIVTLTNTPVTSQHIASAAIINYVIHAAVDVVLNDACKEGLFTNDSYIMQKKPRSVLCVPIIHQGEIFCILYLENNLATGAFPPDRQELLHLLCTQAAISLKNSRLFEQLDSTVCKFNSEVEKRQNTQLQLLHAEKLSALGRLSASIAHEFGNPLMGVKYLLDDFYKRNTLGESDKQLLKLGLEECERMKKLIQDLQRLNKPSTGQIASINIHQLIDNVLLFQKKYFSTNRIRLKKEYDHSVAEVEVIVDQITQVLFNLTMNAVDSMMEYGGVLTVRTKKDGEWLIIEVADTGTGIPYENQEKIFEPFYSTKTEEDGTGLGLSISYGIVKHHKGNLSFVSTPNKGTTFSVSLPDRSTILSKGDIETINS
jgi:predicted ATPase/signal transduction histidine kinase